MIKDDIKKFLKDRWNFIFVILILFIIIYRLYYFFKLGAQPIWWDEGDYLAVSKVWALNQNSVEWMAHFSGMRPLLIPLIWTLFFKLGLGEMTIRFFTLLVPSVVSICCVYLIGKELYDRRVGIIAAFMLSVYWVFTFYTYRLLTDIPATMFGLLAVLFFYRYIKDNTKSSQLYFFFLFGVLAFMTRFPLSLILITCLIFLFAVKRFTVLKDKAFLKSMGFFGVILIPFIIYLIYTKFYFIQFYFVKGIGGLIATNQPFGFYVFGLSVSILGTSWAILFFLGILTLLNLFLGFDIFWKQKNNSLNSDFFVVLWIVLQLIFYVIIFRGATDRWIIMLTVPMFFIASKGLVLIYETVKKYSKNIAIIIVIGLLVWGGYANLKHSSDLIDNKKDTYKEIKLAGEWLKANTPENSKTITASIVQNYYYSERQSYDFYTNDSIWGKCSDIYGALSLNETCQKKTEESFNEKVKRIKPDYMIVSVFEPVFTPQWAYTYPQKYNMSIVQAYMNNQNQPMLVIYKFENGH